MGCGRLVIPGQILASSFLTGLEVSEAISVATLTYAWPDPSPSLERKDLELLKADFWFLHSLPVTDRLGDLEPVTSPL